MTSMIYNNIKEGRFISRPNRFIANIEIDGRTEVCHVKNTGRCRELLLPGARVFVQEFDTEKRKTKYDLISVYKGDMLVNMDSQAPNKVCGEWLPGYFGDLQLLKPEARFGSSRFDFYIETLHRKIFAEVKGVTLENDGVVMFPDAPTERGVKHLRELCKAVDEGYEAYVFFVVQMNMARYFTPNSDTHKEFALVLADAKKHGVNICCVNCNVTPRELSIKDFVEVVL